jgi:N-methylhydantoinase A
MTKPSLRLAVDIGGTFTDTVLTDARNRILATNKTTTTPANPVTGALDGTRRALVDAKANWADIATFIHGTTLATNALIERRGARVATVTTEGFRDILEIGYERRYSQYDINLTKPDLLVPRSRALTIGGRMDAGGQELCSLDEGDIPRLVEEIEASGAEAIAICLLHAYANPAHELQLRDALRIATPGLVVSLSHEVSPEAREFDRLCTTIANAYIQPLIARYLTDLEAAFVGEGLTCPILILTAGGGMTTIETACRLPIRLVESGPAGGAILAARLAAESAETSVLSFDMGGTTAKLCLIDDFRPQKSRRFEIARAARFIKGSGMPVRIPVIEMIEIGAGGGSIAGVDRLGRLGVGPHSAGSNPGPAAFGRGGTAPTVTDADIVQGLIDPARFAEGRLPIDTDAANRALTVGVGEALGLDATGAAHGVSEIVDESMASAARMHAAETGQDLGARVMIAFGGNGPLHATRVARRAGVNRIMIPPDPGVGSAVGFLHAPVSFEIVRSRYALLDSVDLDGLNRFFEAMLSEARTVVEAGAPDQPLIDRRTAFMRYLGQGHEIEIELPNRPLTDNDISDLHRAFTDECRRQFSRPVPDMAIEILNWSVSVASEMPHPVSVTGQIERRTVEASHTRSILCDVSGAWHEASVFDRYDLRPGEVLDGPALIVEPQTTTLVSADFSASIDAAGNIWLERQTGGTR